VGPGSTANAPVVGKYSRRALKGDKYCTDGQASAEASNGPHGPICNWTVAWTAGNVRYVDGTIARNVFEGQKHYWCTRPGDSGGPDYIVPGSGSTIAAKGIISGAGGGGSDHYAAASESPCIDISTDIWDAFPGDILKANI
jgi:hypothetical protein